MNDTKFINHNGQSRKPRLHIEGDGMVVNIINGLTNHDYNAKTTAVAISADQYSGEEWFLLGDSDTPLKYINVRVIQGKLPETKVYAKINNENRQWTVERSGKRIAYARWQDIGGYNTFQFVLLLYIEGWEHPLYLARTGGARHLADIDFTELNSYGDQAILKHFGVTALSEREAKS